MHMIKEPFQSTHSQLMQISNGDEFSVLWFYNPKQISSKTSTRRIPYRGSDETLWPSQLTQTLDLRTLNMILR